MEILAALAISIGSIRCNLRVCEAPGAENVKLLDIDKRSGSHMSTSDVIRKLFCNACLMTGVVAYAPSLAPNVSEPKGQGVHPASAQVAFVDETVRQPFDD